MRLAIALTTTLVVLFSIAGAGIVGARPLYAPAAIITAFTAPAPAADGLRVAADVPVVQAATASVDLPIDGYAVRRTLKTFGTYVDDDRFVGYHAGEDVEFVLEKADVPVHAIADGTVLFVGWATGYGGLIVVAHDVDGEDISAIYGHVNLGSSTLTAGDRVARGQLLANLGRGFSKETDGRRKHLHFGLYPGHELRTAGYLNDSKELSDWIDPAAFFTRHGIAVPELDLPAVVTQSEQPTR
ncbi:M23 family metallopeptidase [Patescibacteria group bacterium]|nr:MAG: M23 family metallopeptidase [Patescibacteria group bacterium]